jgi:hypothetical protein
MSVYNEPLVEELMFAWEKAICELHITHLYMTCQHMVYSVGGVFMGKCPARSVGRLCVAFG